MLLRPVLIPERLHDLLTADKLVYERSLFAPGLGLHIKHSVGVLGDKIGAEQRQRRNNHDDKRDRQINAQHERKRAEDGHDPCKEVREAKQQPISKLFDVGDDPAHYIARGVGVKIGERKPLDMVKRLVTDVVNDAVGHAVAAKAQKPLRKRSDADAYGYLYKNQKDTVKVHIACADDAVYRLPDEQGSEQRANDREHGQNNGKDENGEIAPALFQKLSEDKLH